MATNARVLQCLSCGNTTPHEVLGVHNTDLRDGDGDYQGTYSLFFVECGTCHEAAVHGTVDGDDPYAHWPVKSDLGDDVPDTVVKRYRQALKVKHHLASAFAVQIRRALEALCTEQGATGKDLSAKLTSLGVTLDLPDTIKDVARVARLLGNKGAHDAPDVTRHEALILEEFFLALVEYVYVAPGKLESYRKALRAVKV